VVRRERALTSFTGEARETAAELCVSPDNLAEVTGEERQKRFALEASRMSDEHRPDDEI
jgi:hypothetical protein